MKKPDFSPNPDPFQKGSANIRDRRKLLQSVRHFVHFFEGGNYGLDFFLFYFAPGFRDVAQPGSALRSGRRGRWFESSHPDEPVKASKA